MLPVTTTQSFGVRFRAHTATISPLLLPLSLLLCLYLHTVRIFSFPFLTTPFTSNLDTPFGLPRRIVLVAPPLPSGSYPMSSICDLLSFKPFALFFGTTPFTSNLVTLPW